MYLRHLLEKCIIPAYGKVCGETAQSFYVSLLNKVKNNLASVYKAYGADIEMIARCNKTTGEAVMSVLRNRSNDEEILYYAQRQRDIFSVSGTCECACMHACMRMCLTNCSETSTGI